MGHVAEGAGTRVWPLCIITSWYFIGVLIHPHRLLGFLMCCTRVTPVSIVDRKVMLKVQEYIIKQVDFRASQHSLVPELYCNIIMFFINIALIVF